MNDLYVDAEARGGGVGRALIEAARRGRPRTRRRRSSSGRPRPTTSPRSASTTRPAPSARPGSSTSSTCRQAGSRSPSIGLERVGRDDPVVARPLRRLHPRGRRAARSGAGRHRGGDRGRAAAPTSTRPDGVLLLARVDGDPAAIGGVRHLDTEVAEVKSMYVAPAYRGAGLAGRAARRAASAIAAERGCRAIRLDTSAYLTAGGRPLPLGRLRRGPRLQRQRQSRPLVRTRRSDAADPSIVLPYDPALARGLRARAGGAGGGDRGLGRPGGIHHVGSTAVPGLAAKPTVDILVGVESLDASRACFEPARRARIPATRRTAARRCTGSASPTRAGAPITSTSPRRTGAATPRSSPSATASEPTPSTAARLRRAEAASSPPASPTTATDTRMRSPTSSGAPSTALSCRRPSAPAPARGRSGGRRRGSRSGGGSRRCARCRSRRRRRPARR